MNTSRTTAAADTVPVQPALCGSCIFRQDGRQRIVIPERMDDIKEDARQGIPHICHYPAAHGQHHPDDKRACRGAQDYLEAHKKGSST